MSETLHRTAEQVLALAKKAGADAADAMVLQSVDMNAGIRNGAPETIERSESRGVGLRVFVGQSSATLSSSDFSADALTTLVDMAMNIARAAPADPHAGLAHASQLAKTLPSVDTAEDYEPSMQQLQEVANTCEQAGKNVAGITSSEGADAGFSRQQVVLLTSHGFAGHYSSTQHAISCSLIAGTGDAMERDYDYATRTYHTDLPAPETIGQRAAERTLARLAPRKVNSQTAPVFFDPRTSKQLASAFVGAINGASIARGTSFLKNDMGKPLFASNLQVIDDPLMPRGLGSHPFDAEGIAAKKINLVEHGVLQTWLLDCRSARQLGLATTGHAQRGLASAPHPAATNVYLSGGTLTREALLKSVPHGFYVTETIGHGTNLITGDYSVGASGFWVENGEILFPVGEVTIAGNLRDIFSSLIAADDLAFDHRINAPTVLVPAMTIAGNS